jgi:predicted Rossmann fold nucleotide-binding protein DprA/Smf involved in DNA uptake
MIGILIKLTMHLSLRYPEMFELRDFFPYFLWVHGKAGELKYSFEITIVVIDSAT